MSDSYPFQNMSKIWDLLRNLRQQHPLKLVWIGLENAGKTSLIKRLKTGEFFASTTRTMGLSVDKLFYEADSNLEIISLDLAGQIFFRQNLWNDYLKGASAIIYVFDISDNVERFEETKKELWTYALKNDLSIPILILANKSDLYIEKSEELLKEKLGIDRFTDRTINLFKVSALSGINLDNAFIWLFNSLVGIKKKSKKKAK